MLSEQNSSHMHDDQSKLTNNKLGKAMVTGTGMRINASDD